jgi:ABC-type Fe3+-siderophore transport system permease subunit
LGSLIGITTQSIGIKPLAGYGFFGVCYGAGHSNVAFNEEAHHEKRVGGDSHWLDLDGDSRIDWDVYRDFIGGCMNDIQNMLTLAALMGVGVAFLVVVLIAWINLTGDGND